jgi:chemotaxis protein methyltransferase CheR
MIHTFKNKDIVKVLIQDECSLKDIDELIKLIEQKTKMEISFLNISHIKADLINYLHKYKEYLHLSCDNKSLWMYLKKLSIDIKYDYAKTISHIHKSNIKAIAIGGSAGSLSNIIKILKQLPYCDISVFIVIHILPNEKNNLVNILQQTTNYTVKEAFHGEKINTKHIYIASPDLHMLVQNGHIYHSKTQKVNFCRPAIDVLFKTLSIEYQNTLLAIITCGYLDDGSRSLNDIKNNNGTILIQNPNQCEANDMPINAMTTRCYDHVLDIEEISSYILEKLNFTVDLRDRIYSFMKHIEEVYGYDFTHYDKNSLLRRVNLFRKELNIESFTEFEDLILHDKEIFESLFKKFSINVSEFFRDANMYRQFKTDVIPILATYPHIRVWCSACSSGQEPYSVAMLLDEAGLLNRSIIYATDFNGLIIEQAKNGLFSTKAYEQCKNSYTNSGGEEDINRWFDVYDNYVRIKENIRNKVQFFQHNLVTDGEINEFHVVFCRNVLIYFDEELQDRVIGLINSSLVRNGFLVLGNSEHINSKECFNQQKSKYENKIFKKIRDCK